MSRLEFSIDPGVSRFTVRGVAGGMLSGLGHNPVIGIRDFTGVARFDPESPGDLWMRLTIPAPSLEVQNNASEKDRREMKRVMDQEVLETSAFPEIVFEASQGKITGSAGSSFRAEIDGKLSLHGVARPFRVPAQVTVMGDTLRANGEFTLLMSDYRISPPSVAAGALKLKDELRFGFDILARRQADGAGAAG